MYRKIFLLTLGISLSMLILADFNAQTQPQVTKSKETALGKYINAQEAYEMWKANPER